MIEQERVHFTNVSESNPRGKIVLYWMQQAQRAEYNHALEYAVFRANQYQLPLVVVFVLVDNFPEANLRHYNFMLEALPEIGEALQRRGITLLVRRGDPVREVSALADGLETAAVITDRGYLNVQRQWRKDLAGRLQVQLVEVETDVIVPVQTASDHEEYAARTLRPKIQRQLPVFLRSLRQIGLVYKSAAQLLKKMRIASLDWRRGPELLSGLSLDATVGPVSGMKGGRAAAVKKLEDFFRVALPKYASERNLPTRNALSGLGPYLHFGQISSLEIVLTLTKWIGKSPFLPNDGMSADRRLSLDAFLEELIVRRELAMNFCHFNHGYDSYRRAVPLWARVTLEKHAGDSRPAIYSLRELEQAMTADPIWNACQNEMVQSGKMHGYMRMYWGKKIIEWSRRPDEAFERMLLLNNKYELDGRDPNSFAGVAWCFGKHDRPWGPERAVFGLVRYMNAAGIKRKIKDWLLYVERWYNNKKIKT